MYAFNTFFYPTLMKDGYSRLKRWTRRVDLFTHDIVIVPVHLQVAVVVRPDALLLLLLLLLVLVNPIQFVYFLP